MGNNASLAALQTIVVAQQAQTAALSAAQREQSAAQQAQTAALAAMQQAQTAAQREQSAALHSFASVQQGQTTTLQAMLVTLGHINGNFRENRIGAGAGLQAAPAPPSVGECTPESALRRQAHHAHKHTHTHLCR